MGSVVFFSECIKEEFNFSLGNIWYETLVVRAISREEFDCRVALNKKPRIKEDFYSIKNGDVSGICDQSLPRLISS